MPDCVEVENFRDGPRPHLSGTEQVADSDDGRFRLHYTVEGDDTMPVPDGAVIEKSASSWAFLTGSGRNISALIKLKIAVLAPIPNASESAATAVKPGLLRSVRIP